MRDLLHEARCVWWIWREGRSLFHQQYVRRAHGCVSLRASGASRREAGRESLALSTVVFYAPCPILSLIYILSFNLRGNLKSRYPYPHLKDKETEAGYW